jgi:hypothetical protein
LVGFPPEACRRDGKSRLPDSFSGSEEVPVEQLFLLAMVVFGFLVMFQVIPTRRVGKYFTWLILLMIFAPVLYGITRTKSLEWLQQRHAWWEYLLAILLILILSRAVLDFLFGRRRY